MMKTSLFLCSMVGIVACTGCNALRIVSAVSDVSGAIVNTSLLAGVLGVAINLNSITAFIQNLLGGI